MPVIRWAFLCDYACVDAAGKASIIGTFEYINVSKLPAALAAALCGAGNANYRRGKL